MVVGAIAPEPSGADCSLVAIATAAEASRPIIVAALAAAGLAPRVLAVARDRPAEAALHLIELDGFLTPCDPPLPELLRELGPLVLRSTWLGGYARPLAAGA
jgi:hypothetical protein